MPMPRRPRWDPGEDAGMHVIVPGLMGIGFLISLSVLAADLVARLLPASGRRRAAQVERYAKGRVGDLHAIPLGSAPRRGVVLRGLRRRMTAMVLGSLSASVAVASMVAGFAAAARVGVDRQGWAIGLGIGIGAGVALFGLAWLLAAATGPRAPRWLLFIHRFWPLGGYPDLQRSEHQ